LGRSTIELKVLITIIGTMGSGKRRSTIELKVEVLEFIANNPGLRKIYYRIESI